MPDINTTGPRSPDQWERKILLIEYEVAKPISGHSPIPDLYTVRFACGWGGVGSTEIAAFCDGVRVVRHFKGAGWMDALTQRFEEIPEGQVSV